MAKKSWRRYGYIGSITRARKAKKILRAQGYSDVKAVKHGAKWVGKGEKLFQPSYMLFTKGSKKISLAKAIKESGVNWRRT